MRNWPLIILAIVWIEVFALEVLLGSDLNVFNIATYSLLALGGSAHGLIFVNHEWWRVITSAYLHADIVHLSLNIIAFFSFGIPLSRRTSPYLVVTLFFIAAVFSGFFAAYFHSLDTVAIGASGGIFAIVIAETWMQSISWTASAVPATEKNEAQVDVRSAPVKKSSSFVHRFILGCVCVFFFVVGLLGIFVSLFSRTTSTSLQTMILAGLLGFLPLLLSFLAYREYKKLNRERDSVKADLVQPPKVKPVSKPKINHPIAPWLPVIASFRFDKSGKIDILAHLFGVICGVILSFLFARRAKDYFANIKDNNLVETSNRKLLYHSAFILTLCPALYINETFFKVRPAFSGIREISTQTELSRIEGLCRTRKIVVENPDLDYPILYLASLSGYLDSLDWPVEGQVMNYSCSSAEVYQALKLACKRSFGSVFYEAACIRATISSGNLEEAQSLLVKLKENYKYDEDIAKVELIFAEKSGSTDLGKLYSEIFQKLPTSRDIFARGVAWARDTKSSYVEEFTKSAAEKFPNDNFIMYIRAEYLRQIGLNSDALKILKPIAHKFHEDWRANKLDASQFMIDGVVKEYILATNSVALELAPSQAQEGIELVESANLMFPFLRAASSGFGKQKELDAYEKLLEQILLYLKKNKKN